VRGVLKELEFEKTLFSPRRGEGRRGQGEKDLDLKLNLGNVVFTYCRIVWEAQKRREKCGFGFWTQEGKWVVGKGGTRETKIKGIKVS